MLISFIIIAPNKESLKIDLIKLEKKIAEKNFFAEIIQAFGTNPSKQRNQGAKKAKGKWLYFLDNDSQIDDQALDQFELTILKFPDAVVIGGPSALSGDSTLWQKAIQIVFSSDFGIGPLKSRYYSNGPMRISSEREVILCNLLVQREVFEELKGFNENLYPNEENEFLSRLKFFGQIVYSPLMLVYREHRENYFAFFDQMINYGKGRTRHLLFSNEYTDYIYFIPLVVFCLISVVAVLKMFHTALFGIAFLYFLVILAPSVFFGLYYKNIKLFGLSVLGFAVCHFGYAVGLLLGFFDKKRRVESNVVVEVSFTSTPTF